MPDTITISQSEYAALREERQQLASLRLEHDRLRRLIIQGGDGVTVSGPAANRPPEGRLALLDFAMNSVGEAAFLIDEQSAFRYVNAEACRVLGYSQPELLECSVADVDPDFPGGRWADHWAELREKRSLTFEGRHRTRTGRIFPVEINANYFEYGGVGYNLALVRDISQRRQLEQSLYRQSRMLEGFFAHALTPFAILDRDFNFRMVNTAYAKAGQRAVADFPGHNHFEFYPNPENEVIFRQVVTTRTPYAAKAKPFAYPDHPEWGISYWDWTLTPLLDRAGEVEFLAFSLEDVTPSQHAVEAVRIERQRLYDVLETLPVYVVLISPDYHVPFANRYFRDRFGESAGRCCYQYLFSRSTPCESCETFKVLETGQPHGWEWLGPDGHTYEVYDFPFSDSDGSQLILEMGIDISARKQAVETVRLREVFIRNILETVDEGFIVVDRDYRIQAANRAFCEQVQLPEAQVVGRPCQELAPHNGRPCHDSDQECPVRRTFASGAVHSVTHVQTEATGRKRHLEVKTYPMRAEPGGEVVTVIETITDVTARKRLEEQLHQSQKLESVGRLAGGVAHDFNNMLGVILGYTEIALSGLDHSLPLAADLLEIRKAAERSADLTRQLLTFARRQDIVPRVLDLNESVEGMLKMLRRLIGEDIELIWQPGTRVWPVKMDPSQINQLLANLCVNARDAIAGSGRIAIATGNHYCDKAFCDDQPGILPGEYVLLTVSDTGCGMDHEVLSKLFEPFFTTKELGRGTGLGLATVYGVVSQSGGFIRVASEPGQGTSFMVYLPRHHAAPEQAAAQPAKVPIPGGQETILVVEDEASILLMVQRILGTLGYRVLTAASPAEALRLASEEQGPIDLLITDVVMPGMNGRELAAELRAICPGLRCLFMSGYTGDVVFSRGVLQEEGNFLQKPFFARDLAGKVRETLDADHP